MTRIALVATSALVCLTTCTAYAQPAVPRSFTEAISAMESILARPDITPDDAVVMRNVLGFVRQSLPASASRSAAPASSSSGCWMKCCYRTCFGRCRCCWVWVPTCPKKYSKDQAPASSESVLAERVRELQNELASQNPRLTRDLALQVYSVTVIADEAFVAGAIRRQP